MIEYSPGGLATLGNVTMWLPLCNGKGTQVTSGLAEELLKLSVEEISRNPLPEAKKESCNSSVTKTASVETHKDHSKDCKCADCAKS